LLTFPNFVTRKIFLTLFAVIAAAAVIFLSARPDRKPSVHDITIDRIVVEKSERKLSTFRGGHRLKTYRIALGQNPAGAKEEEGDMKTPEGIYQVDCHKPDSDYHLALHISYPSEMDKARAAARGVSAGSDIEIHGLPNGHISDDFHPWNDWTAGCIALTDREIEELFRVAPDGTTVEIRP
jgi:murein L,D-transpeptidase YafK